MHRNLFQTINQDNLLISVFEISARSDPVVISKFVWTKFLTEIKFDGKINKSINKVGLCKLIFLFVVKDQ